MGSEDGDSKAPRRWLRWAGWLTLGVAGSFVVVVVGALALLRGLERPWIKARIAASARSAVGLDVDYRVASVDLVAGTARIEGLVVRAPEAVRAYTPELARVETVEARWSTIGLLHGKPGAVEEVRVSGVRVAVAADEKGRTTFDVLPSSGPPSKEPPTPRSRLAASFLSAPLPIGRVAVNDVGLTVVRTDHGKVADEIALSGLSLALAASSVPAPGKGARVDISLGSSSSPLPLSLMRKPAGAPSAAAHAKLWLALQATPSAVSSTLDLRMVDQTFAATVTADRWLHVEAQVDFDPRAAMTKLSVLHVQAGDGALAAEASAELPDSGDPLVRSARVDVDGARLLAWLPAGLVPVTADRARVHGEARDVIAAAVPRVADGGSLAAEVEAANVAASLSGGAARVAGASVSLHAEPAKDGGIAARGGVKLTGTKIDLGAEHVAFGSLGLDLDGRQATDGALAGKADLRVDAVEHAGAVPARASEVRATVGVDRLLVNAGDPMATRGDVAISVDLGSVEARPAGQRVTFDGLSLRAHTALEGHAPYALELEVPMRRARFVAADGKTLVDAPVHVEVRARDVRPDLARPVSSHAVVHAEVQAGDVRAVLDGTKEPDAVDFVLHADAASLRLVKPFLPPAVLGDAPWDAMKVRVDSKGRAERLSAAAPELAQETRIDVDGPAFRNVSARSLSVRAKTQGSALHLDADLDVAAKALVLEGADAKDDHIALKATFDRLRPSLAIDLATDGRATSKLTGSVSFEPSRRAIAFTLGGRFAGLAPLAALAAKVPGLDGFDLSELEIDGHAEGAVLGVVSGFTPAGAAVLEASPTRTLAVEGKADWHLSHFHFTKGDTAVLSPAFTWRAELRTSQGRRTLASHFLVDAMHLDLGSHDVDLHGIDDEATVTVSGDVAHPDVQVEQRASLHAIEQDLVPEYPLGDVTLDLAAEHSPEGMLHVSDLKIGNGAGGTTLDVTGNVFLGAGRQSLSLTTTLGQELAKLGTIPDRFKGTGKVSAEAAVTSPDLKHFTVRAAVKGEKVSLTFPRQGVELDGADAEVPITVALTAGEGGVRLERSESRSPYSMLRFSDQHPLLTRSGFLSIERLKTPFVTVAPLVGNLAIDQNVVSLRQFEMGVRGGRITGQCGVDWDGPRSTVELHVRATGVQSSHGEPFDGNIAVAVSAADRTVEGRAEILRIGERHLLDLLDLQDPQHVDPAMNRIRTALKFGYPDHLRLVFDHGFASAHLELGGLARLVSIGELRGIPMGPIVDKILAPVLDGPDQKESP